MALAIGLALVCILFSIFLPACIVFLGKRTERRNGETNKIGLRDFHEFRTESVTGLQAILNLLPSKFGSDQDHFPIFVLLRLGEAGLYCVITHSNTFDYLVYLKNLS